MRIRVVGKPPLHLPLGDTHGIEGLHNFPACIAKVVVPSGIPVIIQGKVYPVIGAGTLDRRVENTERLLERFDIVGQIHRPHVVPLLVVDLVADDPVGHLARVWIRSVVMLRQERRDGSCLLKPFLGCRIEHVVKCVGRLLGSRIYQLRRSRIPVV